MLLEVTGEHFLFSEQEGWWWAFWVWKGNWGASCSSGRAGRRQAGSTTPHPTVSPSRSCQLSFIWKNDLSSFTFVVQTATSDYSVGAQRGGEGSSQNILGAFRQSPPFTHTLACALVSSGDWWESPSTLVTNAHSDGCSRSAISSALQNSDFTDSIPPTCHLHKFIIIWSVALFSIQCCDCIHPGTLNLISTSFQKRVINVVGCHFELKKVSNCYLK